MPKMKTVKSVKDRFKVTGSGKILRRKVGHRHLKGNKSNASLRRGKIAIQVHGPMEVKVKKMLGI